jgi:hypothetical protein
MAVLDPAQAGGERSHAYARTSRGPNGWIIFASIALCLAGFMRLLDSIWAFQYHGALPEHLQGAIFGHNLKTYAWLYLILGVVLLCAGLAVLSRSEWARWIGMIAGALSPMAAIPWMPYYPVWSLVYIGIGFLVIYALAIHGRTENSF